MKKIVLPTDFSDNAQNAIEYALHLFEREECIFYLVHAHDDVTSAPDNVVASLKELKKKAKRIKVKNDNPKHRFKTILETDSVLNLVNRTVIDNAVEYVFMGTKGASALRGIFMGTNTVEVIKHLASCPIVVIPENYDCHLPEEIVFSSDFKHAFIAPELAALITIAKLRDSAVSVVHIHTKKELGDDQKRNKEELKNSLKELRSTFREVTMKTSISSTLYHLEQENEKIGMLVLLNTKHGFFKKLLREPIMKIIAFQTNVPLLVLPQIAD